VNLRTFNEPTSFLGVDLGQDRLLLPSMYTIRNRDSSTHVCLNWQLQASVTLAPNEWVIIDSRSFHTGNPSEDS